MINEIQDGKRITWTNGTGSDVSAGDPVVIGSQVGVACVDIANGAAGAVQMEGVFQLPKVSGASAHAIAQGEAVLFDVSVAKFDLKAAVAAAGDISGCCIAWDAALTTDTVVKVKLNVGVGTVETG